MGPIAPNGVAGYWWVILIPKTKRTKKYVKSLKMYVINLFAKEYGKGVLGKKIAEGLLKWDTEIKK